MSDFPKNRHELLRAGCRQGGNGICRGCGASIQWWKTAKGKAIPMDPVGLDEYAPAVTHWSTCPKADSFKNGGTGDTPADASSLEREVRALRSKTNARVVVLVSDEGTLAFWRTGISGEELRSDLIAAGNFVRSEIGKVTR